MLKRILSAFIGMAIIIPIIVFSAFGVKILIFAVACICLFEFYKMALLDRRFRRLARLLSCINTFTLIFFPEVFVYGLIFSVVGGIFYLVVTAETDLKAIPSHLGLTVLGFCYISLLIHNYNHLRILPEGGLWILLILAGTFLGDSVAYFTGKFLGKHAFFPRISPQKTWEGFGGQVVGGFLGVFVFQFLFGPKQATLTDLFVLGTICAILCPMGDLFESLLKRGFGVKDSGSIMPGHGGLLDRADALLFSGPASYIYLQYFHG
jgi:phosphatidate cytidylyltransferase